MKPMHIKKNTWHGLARIATFYGDYCQIVAQGEGTDDICHYTREFLRGLFAIALIVLVACLASLPLIEFFAWVIAGITYTFVAPTNGWVVVWGLYVGVALIALYHWVMHLTKDWRLERIRAKLAREEANGVKERPIKSPSQLTLMYRAWKDKLCFKVIVDD